MNTTRSSAPAQVAESLPPMVDCRMLDERGAEIPGREASDGSSRVVVQIVGPEALERKRAVMTRAVRVFVPTSDRRNGIKLLLRASAALEVAS